MAEIINLNRARKERAAAEKKARAAGNRAKHGRGKAEASLSEAEKALMREKLDAHRRDRPEEDEDSGPEPA
jgi:hypothetical protein